MIFSVSVFLLDRRTQRATDSEHKLKIARCVQMLPAAVGRSMCGGDDAILNITDQRPSRCGHGSQDAAVARILCDQALNQIASAYTY